jgi:hypothetical protein
MTPGVGSLSADGFLSAAKEGLKAGLRGAFSIENIVGALATLLLALSDRIAADDAVVAIATKFVQEGFAKGVAAGAMGWTKQEMKSIMNRVTNFRLQGLADPGSILTLDYMIKLATACENYAVAVGYSYSSEQTLQWKESMRSGLKVLQQRGYHFGEDPRPLFEYDFIDKFAWVLRPITNMMIEVRINWKYRTRYHAQPRRV